jgi:hypothetical protein
VEGDEHKVFTDSQLTAVISEFERDGFYSLKRHSGAFMERTPCVCGDTASKIENVPKEACDDSMHTEDTCVSLRQYSAFMTL